MPRLREMKHVRPRGGTPLLPLGFVAMRRTRPLAEAEASVFEPLRHGEDMVVDPEALVHELLDHGRTPAGATEPAVTGPLINQSSEGGFVRGGQCGRPSGLGAGAGLGVHGKRMRNHVATVLSCTRKTKANLCAALAIQEREDGEETFDLAQSGQVRGGLQWLSTPLR